MWLVDVGSERRDTKVAKSQGLWFFIYLPDTVERFSSGVVR
jgi:hypothetical protein